MVQVNPRSLLWPSWLSAPSAQGLSPETALSLGLEQRVCLGYGFLRSLSALPHTPSASNLEERREITIWERERISQFPEGLP